MPRVMQVIIDADDTQLARIVVASNNQVIQQSIPVTRALQEICTADTLVHRRSTMAPMVMEQMVTVVAAMGTLVVMAAARWALDSMGTPVVELLEMA